MKRLLLLCWLALSPFTGVAQTTSDIVCADDLKVHEIPFRHPVGCEIWDCCPSCPGPLPLDWRIHLAGDSVQPIELEFHGLTADQLKRLKVEGNAKFVADGRLLVQKGDSIVHGLTFSREKKDQVFAAGKIALKPSSSKPEVQAKSEADLGRVDFSINQVSGQVVVRQMSKAAILRKCKTLGGSGSSPPSARPASSASALGVVREDGSDRFHLIATFPDGLGRLVWSPSNGWETRWSRYTDVDEAANRFLGFLAPLSWYDHASVTGGTAGLQRGPQIQAYISYLDPRGSQNSDVLLAQPSWFTDLSGQFVYQWTSIVPPAATQNARQGFWPMSGSAWTEPTSWHASVFGLDDNWGIPLNRPRSLREFRGSSTQAWQFIEHGRPSRSGYEPDNLGMGLQSSVFNSQDHSTWLFVRSALLRTPFFILPEVWCRIVHPTQPANDRWVSLGSPFPRSDRPDFQAIEMAPPIAVAREEGGLFKINLFVLVLATTGTGQPGDSLQWELWERFFDGNQWQNWASHGMIPGEVADVLRTDFNNIPPFLITTGVVWHMGGKLRINLFGSALGASTRFGIPAGKIFEYFWDGNVWKWGALRDAPPSAMGLFVQSSYVLDTPTRVHIGVLGSGNGEIWEMSWGDSSDWSFERLYPR